MSDNRAELQTIIVANFMDAPNFSNIWSNAVFDVKSLEKYIFEGILKYSETYEEDDEEKEEDEDNEEDGNEEEKTLNISNPWGSLGLSLNPCITPEFVLKYQDRQWDYNILSKNRIVTNDLVITLAHKDWNPLLLSRNPSITPEIVSHLPTWKWTFGKNGWSENPNIDLNHLVNHPELYDWKSVSRNPAVTPDFVRQNLSLPWVWGEYGLSCNPSTITDISFIDEFSELFTWGYHGLSMIATPEIYHQFPRNYNLINPKTGKKYTNYWYWGQGGFSNNLNITEEFIYENRNQLFSWDIVARNPVVTPVLLEQLYKLHRIYLKNVDNGNVTQDDFKMWNRIKFGPFGLSVNPNMTVEYIQKTINRKWSFSYVGGLISNKCYGIELYNTDPDPHKESNIRSNFLTPMTFSAKYDPYYDENIVKSFMEYH